MIAAIAQKLRKAANRGEQARLTADEVRALLTSPAYATLAELERQEIAAAWKPPLPRPPRPARPKSEGSGSGNAPSGAASGASAGTTPKLVERAESELAFEEAQKAILRARLKKRSPSTSQAKGRQLASA